MRQHVERSCPTESGLTPKGLHKVCCIVFFPLLLIVRRWRICSQAEAVGYFGDRKGLVLSMFSRASMSSLLQPTLRSYYPNLEMNLMNFTSFLINKHSLFFSFYGCIYGIWKFLGQGLIQSCSCQLMSQAQQHHWIQTTSVTYTAACGNMGSLTH